VEALIQSFFNVAIMEKVGPYLLKGLMTTLGLSALVIPIGFASGLAVAVLWSTERKWVRWPLAIYVDLFRAFPPLVLLLFIYYGLPFLGIQVPAIVAVAIGFLLNTSSYYGEIFRAGIESVPRGQIEAARSTGLTRGQTLIYIVLPQAVRNVLPDLISNTLEVVKLTSIASVVALPELLFQARQAQSVTYNATPIMVAAIAYFILLWPLVRVLSRLENRQLAGRR
jgi:polar amino acid transport system permease protein